MNKKFFKNIVMLDNLIPSEIYLEKFKILAIGTSSTQRNYFSKKIILNFKNFYKFNNKTYKKLFENEFKSNIYFKTKKNNKYLFLNNFNNSNLNELL